VEPGIVCAVMSHTVSSTTNSGSSGIAAGGTDLAPHVCPVDEFEGDWWVVHTRPRHEKALAADLENQRIGYFLPLVTVKRKYRGRGVEVQLPLFPSYLFLCGGDDERYAAFNTRKAVNIIAVVAQEQLKQELRQIHRLVMSRQPLDLYPALQRGRRCRVISGPLAGLEGVVLRRRNVCKVYVGVEALGQSAELEIDPSLLEVIE